MRFRVWLIAVALLAGCRQQAAPDAKGSAAPPPAAVSVKTATAVAQRLVEFREFTGRTAAVSSVDIRARVSGYLLESPQRELAKETTTPRSERSVKVREGEFVSAGTLLFLIDPLPYQIELKQTEGSLEAARAKLKQANQTLSRQSELFQRNAGSEADVDQAVAEVASLQGQIDSLRATAARNRLDLEYTEVRSPIDGLLGRALLTNGNLVVADSTVLTTVVANDPVYAHFEVDEQSVLDYRKRRVQGEAKDARKTKIPVRLALANESGYPHEGTIDFVNNTTNPSTGNTSIRGVFPNPTGILSPGLFARVQVPFTEPRELVLIPTAALAMDQQGRFVMVVDEKNIVSRRAVKTGSVHGDKTAIADGLRAGEQVIISGLQKVRPGVKVEIGSDQQTASEPADEQGGGTQNDDPGAADEKGDAAGS